MKRVIDNFHSSERKKYLTEVSSYSLKDLIGIIDKYKAELSNNPGMFKDVLRYFYELNFRTNSTLYEQNKEVYLKLLRSFIETIIQSEAFHDAFFACNCIEFGRLTNDYYSNKIQPQYQILIKDLIKDIKKHPTFFKRCQNLYDNKQYGKYYVIGIKRLLKLIEITKNSQHPNPIDDYLSQFSINTNLNRQNNMGEFLKKIDLAIFMSKCVERNLRVTFDEIYPYYHQWRSDEKSLLRRIKYGKNLSKFKFSDDELPDDEIRISAKDLKKRKRKYPTD